MAPFTLTLDKYLVILFNNFLSRKLPNLLASLLKCQPVVTVEVLDKLALVF
jgi:hypothetical protein